MTHPVDLNTPFPGSAFTLAASLLLIGISCGGVCEWAAVSGTIANNVIDLVGQFVKTIGLGLV